MVKPEWGTKRTCPKCATRFYDLVKEDPVTCIECGTEFVPEPVLKSKQPLPFEAADTSKKPVKADSDLSGGDDVEQGGGNKGQENKAYNSHIPILSEVPETAGGNAQLIGALFAEGGSKQFAQFPAHNLSGEENAEQLEKQHQDGWKRKAGKKCGGAGHTQRIVSFQTPERIFHQLPEHGQPPY